MRNFLILVAIVLSLTILAGCKRVANQTAEESPASQASPEPTPRDEFERNLQYIRRAHFKYVWLFSRKDRAPLDKDDAEFLRTNTPRAVDRVRADEEGRRFLVGLNFEIEPENLAALRKRFNVEDYSGK